MGGGSPDCVGAVCSVLAEGIRNFAKDIVSLEKIVSAKI